MKKIIITIIMVLIATQAAALDTASFNINVTVNKGPNITDFSPSDGYKVTEGDSLEISVNANDPNNDTLQYQFLINNNIKQPWSNNSSFNYTLGQNDIGLNNIRVEVTDGLETVQTEEVEIYVFRKAPNLP